MRDIFNILEVFDNGSHVRNSIKCKENQIKKLKSECGSCCLWMTNECPTEKFLKVTCSMPVCDNFKQSKWSFEHTQKLESEIIELNNHNNKNRPTV